MISDELSNALFGFSLRRLGAELQGGSQHPPPPSGGGKSRDPSGRGLNQHDRQTYLEVFLLFLSTATRVKHFLS